MNREAIKKQVFAYIQQRGAVSYVNLEDFFRKIGYDYTGELACSVNGTKVITWMGWKREAYEMLKELMQEGKIVRVPCDPIIYIIDGKYIDAPIFDNMKMLKNRSIKGDIWAPCLFNAIPE